MLTFANAYQNENPKNILQSNFRIEFNSTNILCTAQSSSDRVFHNSPIDLWNNFNSNQAETLSLCWYQSSTLHIIITILIVSARLFIPREETHLISSEGGGNRSKWLDLIVLSTGRAKWRSDLHNNGLSETDETKNRKGDTSNAICHAENGPEISTVLRIAEEIRMFKLLFVSVFVMVCFF